MVNFTLYIFYLNFKIWGKIIFKSQHLKALNFTGLCNLALKCYGLSALKILWSSSYHKRPQDSFLAFNFAVLQYYKTWLLSTSNINFFIPLFLYEFFQMYLIKNTRWHMIVSHLVKSRVHTTVIDRQVLG